MSLLTRIIPPAIKRRLPRGASVIERHRRQWIQDNPYHADPPSYTAPDSHVRLGILEDPAQYHKSYIAACRELGVSYEVLNLLRSDWLEAIARLQCDAYLVWPPGLMPVWKGAFDDRLRVMETDLGILVYPTCDETYLFEDKRRTLYWLQAHEIPHPRTWVFYDREEARAFAASCTCPVVVKTAMGASATGVWILRHRSEALAFVNRAFSRGLLAENGYEPEREWGSIIFQEYLPGVREWRMVRIGDSYFGHPKGQRGDFHSGSGVVLWDVPEDRHLDLLHDVTEAGGFTSMDVDVFETPDGRLLVNELHTVFGASYAVDQLRQDGKAGRFVHARGQWVFEEGSFARNACANARVDYVIGRLRDRRAAAVHGAARGGA